MSTEQPIDYEAARERFPWIGLGTTEDQTDHAARYREIMAEARVDREIVRAIDDARRSA